MPNVTIETYNELQLAYDFFNERLFDNKLPPCLITLQRERRTYGYFSKSRFVNSKGDYVDELAMNPSYFGVRSIKKTLSTLVHEQTHAYQMYFGKPGRKGYHNKEWAKIMRSIDLIPSDTGEEGGKDTGQQMTHYIKEGGRFDIACDELLSEEFKLSWYDRFPPVTASSLGINVPLVDDDEQNEDLDDLDEENEDLTINPVLLSFPNPSINKSNRDKFRCPNCGAQVWGKPSIKVKCGEDSCDNAIMECVDD
ncbi:SprT-like domain-containing protein [Acinetobacter baumannii]|nr:SprT-like domain-containing protein [Acinetobacter baumannii]